VAPPRLELGLHLWTEILNSTRTCRKLHEDEVSPTCGTGTCRKAQEWPPSCRGVDTTGGRSKDAVDDPVQALVVALSYAVAACRAAGDEEAAWVAWQALGELLRLG
jgi:hypothetical protein